MRVLVTRPEPDAGEIAARLAAMGHEAVVDPLLEVELLPPAPDLLSGAAALVVTSRNALRALAESPALATALQLPVYVVGPGTDEVARSLGFTRAAKGAGAARDLVPLVAAAVRSHPGAIHYLAGEALSFDLAAALRAAGCEVCQTTVYRTVEASSLSARTLDLFRRSAIDAVLMMSPRTAACYCDLVLAAGIAHAVRAVPHLCLSPRVADALARLALDDVRSAARPTTEELLALVAAQRHTPPRVG